MKCLLITELGDIRKYEAPDLTALQEAVNGNIEFIRLSFCDMIVNEEYVYCCEFINLWASLILSADKMQISEIKGNALLVGPCDENGKTTDITIEIIDNLFNKFPILKGCLV